MFIPFPPSEIRILGMENITIPKLYRIRQDYTDNALEHPERELEQVLSRILTGKNLRRKRIAVTAGSRGVPGYAALLREICRTLRAFGAQGRRATCRLAAEIPPLAQGAVPLDSTPRPLGAGVLVGKQVGCGDTAARQQASRLEGLMWLHAS